MGNKIVLINQFSVLAIHVFKVALFGVNNFKIYDASILMKQFNTTRYWKISKQSHWDMCT